jgi:hypothetical protein
METKPGSRTSEFRLAVAAVVATAVMAAMKGAGVALAGLTDWWAAPLAMAITSLGYSISRALVKRGVLPGVPVSDTLGIPLKTPGS